jgi:hypothetical protein
MNYRLLNFNSRGEKNFKCRGASGLLYYDANRKELIIIYLGFHCNLIWTPCTMWLSSKNYTDGSCFNVRQNFGLTSSFFILLCTKKR